jgi:quinol monooxygenase YgiN
MAADVSWVLELNVQPGHEKDFPALVEDMVRATQEDEPGTLGYQWSTSADGGVCHIYEHYVDSAAVLTHLATFGEKFAGRFLEILAPTRFVVYGSPSQEVKDALAAFQPVYMQSAGGFSR